MIFSLFSRDGENQVFYLIEDYKNNENLKSIIRKGLFLAFLKEKNVLAAWNLIKTMLFSYKKEVIKNLTKYFESTWLGIFENN